ncbi:Histone-lysine N-methyltransferase, H3 lysine-9 specific SUVH1 [Hibiscus syriacus]|uniref:Histone-lysine N-methyltransferase, H3 lysine-9 specific SUVH1 n=1 Tax=Hibiscus syriacus TaxID=106335 RepID=A0A6A3B9X7_HIBSY|nr:histone-lysine N-methyltransferase, H3 lysine-9 specific SUVH1-like [Hibiscus syriacus]XP_039071882.1 histone-lysine N-methyltransferase, H3 lysine-9 specific SUVH1-like [Hibiscus syriacus]XP_039071883.1 histone-lysine N-methyltransferase, H3 lysine-9 specific SUVH1-like [Hibiscus syriacus]KAE8713850.1 Histone-lysine N-methyltransferase, H3 lysine-9 specific SUVH1 [Hibiscus syriacus]
MDGGLGGNTVPTNTSDKSRVLNVKPLRTLFPLFPEPPEGPPFVCVPPNGPFPSGFSPFFPFSGLQGSQSTPDLNQNHFNSTAVPLRSFRAEPPGSGNGNHKHKSAGPSSVKRKAKRRKESESVLTSLMNLIPGISLPERDDGNRELVESVLLRFDALRRKLSQMEDAKELHSGIIKRSDLKAANMMFTKGVRTNMKKRIGVVPGVEIGDIFFFRMELSLVGLHFPSMAGIDYMAVKGGESEGERLALNIVASGGYDDDDEDPDVLVYSGQGGSASRDKEASDQQLVRGNLALERSFHRGNEVRVIRGLNVSLVSKVYVYDGLYKIQELWTEKGKSGCNMFKYKLVRIPGQPAAFATWKSIQKWKESSRVGLILPDITSGAESMPVSLVNEVDDEKGPAHFTYSPTVRYSKSFKLVQPSYVCNCHDACQPGDSSCSCIQKNGGDFPYTTNGVLACRKPMIYECGPSCPCIRNCKNRVIQTGLKARLEVFKTRDRGWGLRSWDPIRAGTFICEYAGEVIDETNARQDGENEYVFHTSRLYKSFKWNFESESTEDFDIPSPVIISSKNSGNVARFMNHSCSPNVFWQPIMYESNNEAFLHIAFFAKKHIPPMTELTFDYGTPLSDGTDADNNPAYGKKQCLCGSAKCCDYFY